MSSVLKHPVFWQFGNFTKTSFALKASIGAGFTIFVIFDDKRQLKLGLKNHMVGGSNETTAGLLFLLTIFIDRLRYSAD